MPVSATYRLSCVHLHVDGVANWAEISGTKQTNAAIESGTPWTRRWGHAAISQLFSAAETAAGKLSRIYILGGDDRMQLATMNKDFRAYPGGGSFRNDVWATTGIGTVPSSLSIL